MASRRALIRGALGVALLGAGIAAYWPVIEKIVRPKWRGYGPDPQTGARYVVSSCLGCNVRCGIIARVVNVGGVDVVERIMGNPYHPYNRAKSLDAPGQGTPLRHLPYNTPIGEVYRGGKFRYLGTLCPRGQDGIHYLYDPYRVVRPLRRAGPRGSGKWKEITWEELIRCVVDGCEIPETGERLPGLREIFVYGKLRDAGFDPNAVLAEMKRDVDSMLRIAKDPKTTYGDLARAIEEFKAKWGRRLGERGLELGDILIDPDRPDLGTKANQLVYVRGRGQGHADYFYQRWTYAFGSVNWLRHTSACQLGYYVGNYLWAGYHDINPDPVSSRVIIMAGANMGRQHPGATGQGLMIARACEGGLKVYYVNPAAPRTTCRGNIVWIPIRPGYDSALAMAMVRWLIENGKFNVEFLRAPNEKAAKARGYPVHTNATWLVITEGKRAGEFLRARDVGMDGGDVPLVVSGGSLAPYDAVEAAELEYSGRVRLADGEEVAVKTTFMILKEEAFKKGFEEWLAEASPYEVGTPEFDRYVGLVLSAVRDFADAAPEAATYIHRGAGMHPNGEYTVWAYRVLDILIGNYHRKGGLLGRAAHTKYNNYLYNTGKKGFGEPVRWGPPIDRHRYAYEDTLEYWLRVKRALAEGKGWDEAVKAAYPAKRPWYPMTVEESYTELFAGIAEAYPYPIRALILFYANPVLAANYGVKFVEVLRDVKKLPLFIAITTTINETYMYADLIVPDTTYLETGTTGVQYLYASSGSVLLAEAWRSPVVMPLTQYIGECPNGHPRHASMWEFLIDVAKALDMPGHGDRAMPGLGKYEGRWYSLHCVWEYVMRVFANAAMDARDRGLIPSEVPRDEVEWVERNYPIARFRDLVPDEWPYMAYALARGGVFTGYDESFDERGISKRKVPSKRKRWRLTLMLWNEDLARTRNSVTGQKFWGGPKYFPPATYAPVGTALRGDAGPHGTPLRQLYGPREWPLTLIYLSGPLYTKHRSQFYYWIKQVAPENFAVLSPRDARRIGVETGDVIRVETPTGSLEVPAVVEPTVPPGIVMVPYGMGRWADTAAVRPRYFQAAEPRLASLLGELPERAEVPPQAVNPVRSLPETAKKLLFTKSPSDYYDGAAVDKWRFNGVTPNVVEASDPSLGDWPLLSWIGASQAYFDTPARIVKTGKKHRFEQPNVVW